MSENYFSKQQIIIQQVIQNNFMIVLPDLSNTMQMLCGALVYPEVKVSFWRGGEGGMPHNLTVQLTVWLHCTWRGEGMFYLCTAK